MRAAILCCAAAFLSIACPHPETEGVFVGEVNGVMLAVVASGDLVTAYACDGNYDYLGVHAWFHGELADGVGTLKNADGASLILEFDGDRFNAVLLGDTITLGPHKFDQLTAADGAAGLYRGAADGWVGGWIVDATGEQRGAAIKEETDDVSLAFIDPAQSSVVLDDVMGAPVLPLARMTTPEPVE